MPSNNTDVEGMREHLKRLTAEQVAAALPSPDKPMSISGIVARLKLSGGGSRSAVRYRIDELIESGEADKTTDGYPKFYKLKPPHRGKGLNMRQGKSPATAEPSLADALAEIRRKQAEKLAQYEAQLADEMAEASARVGKKIRAALSERIKASKDETLKQLWRDYNSTLKASDTEATTPKPRAKSNAATFGGDISAVVKYIAANAGTEGVPTRRLTSEYGKADWDAVLDGKAKKKGEGSAGKWFPLAH